MSPLHSPGRSLLSPILRERAGRYSCNRYAGCNIPRDDRSGADHRSGADSDAAEDYYSRAERRSTFYDRFLKLPVGLRLNGAGFRGSSREPVVHEKNTVSNEDLVLDRHARADERMALNLAVGTDRDLPLDLDERAHAGTLADLAAVEVRERMQYDVATQLDVVEKSIERLVGGAGTGCQARYAPFFDQ